MKIFDENICELSEGALWHPIRQELFWFDVNNRKLYARGLNDSEAKSWDMPEMFSAAAWIDDSQFLMVSETGLWFFDVENNTLDKHLDVETDLNNRRSCDGRTDPMGGFWFGMMDKDEAANAGVIYRYYKGELKKIYDNLTKPSAICFSLTGDYVFYSDTVKGRIHHAPLDNDGWPLRESDVYRDLRMEGRYPDGAITDAEGNLWNVQWGSGRIGVYGEQGDFIEAHETAPALLSSLAFGGEEFDTLFVTSCTIGLKDPESEGAGKTYFQKMDRSGKAEPAFVIFSEEESEE